jgi:hypothetical protein
VGFRPCRQLLLLRIKKQKSEMPDDGSETFNCHVLPGTERRAQVRETQLIDAHNQEVPYQ